MSVKTSAPWQRLSSEELEERVRAALAENASYRDRDEPVLGVPGTVLDRRVFYDALMKDMNAKRIHDIRKSSDAEETHSV